MPKTTTKTTVAKTAPRPKRKRRSKLESYDIEKELTEIHAMVEYFGKLNLKPFNAAEDQREIRRKELGG